SVGSSLQRTDTARARTPGSPASVTSRSAMWAPTPTPPPAPRQTAQVPNDESSIHPARPPNLVHVLVGNALGSTDASPSVGIYPEKAGSRAASRAGRAGLHPGGERN